ncbi:DUF3139 domain-containing protein [Aneurinibacillus sp. REN35]|uniref:DUF3139 domain-containing protein n=1 Tax=Aneurinibacillus sp. REN35 TaxID=3237286 RepID=UPI003528928D
MKRRGWKVILFFILGMILLSPFALIYILNHGIPWMNYFIKQETVKHLHNMGHNPEAILEQHTIAPKMSINKDYYHTHYMVIFKDEPTVTYYYGKRKLHGSLDQFCEKDITKDGATESTTAKAKHSENSCVSMLANRE